MPVSPTQTERESQAKLASRGPKGRRVARHCHVIAATPEKNQARFKCHNCGHKWTAPMMRKAPNGRLPDVETIRFFARYWSDGVVTFCPKCSTVA